MTDIKTGVKTPFVVCGIEAWCCNPLPPFFMRAPQLLLTLELSADDIYKLAYRSNLFMMPDNELDYTSRLALTQRGDVLLIVEQKKQRGE